MSAARANWDVRCVRAGQKQCAIKQLTAVVLVYLTALTPLSSFGAEPMFLGPAVRYSSGSPAPRPHATARPGEDSDPNALKKSLNSFPTPATLAPPEPPFFSGG